MTTARDIIYRALEDVGVIGVGQTPLAEDMNYGLNRLNAMIGQWNRRNWLVFHTQDVTCITTGQGVYTLGVGQQFDVPIVDKLESGCFVRQYLSGSTGGSDFNTDFNNDYGAALATTTPPQSIDYPLQIIESRSDWNRIAMKNLPSWPTFVFYNYACEQRPALGDTSATPPTYPTGYVHINPVPNAGQFEIHLNVKSQLTTLTNLSTALLTPPEYEEALEYNLAIRFAAKYQIDAPRDVLALARAAMATLRSANNRTPLLQLPGGLTANGARYNILSDRMQ